MGCGVAVKNIEVGWGVYITKMVGEGSSEHFLSISVKLLT